MQLPGPNRATIQPGRLPLPGLPEGGSSAHQGGPQAQSCRPWFESWVSLVLDEFRDLGLLGAAGPPGMCLIRGRRGPFLLWEEDVAW